MELVLVELDAGVDFDATECSEVAGAELVGGTDPGNGRGRRMERGRDGRREPERRAGAAQASRVCPAMSGGTGDLRRRSPSFGGSAGE
jgi:hypothetical protein